MITTRGRDLLRLHLASPGLYGSIALGIGSAAPTVNDSRLEFEIARLPVGHTAFDFESNRIILRSAVPGTVAGRVSEVALVPNSSTDYDFSRILVSFDPDFEEWSGGAESVANTRVGEKSIRVSATTGNTTTITNGNLGADLSNYADRDTMAFAFHNVGNVSAVRVVFGTDSSNYYTYTRTTPPAGYNIARWAKGSMTPTGAPSWSNINYVSVAATATGGTGNIDCDAIRLDKEATTGERFIISRNIITPIVVPFGSTADFETSLGVAF